MQACAPHKHIHLLEPSLLIRNKILINNEIFRMPLLKQLYSPKQFENMTKTLLLWVFLLINILMFSATGSTFTTKGNKRKSKVTIFFCFFSAIFSCPTSLCLISYIKKSNSNWTKIC